MSSLDRLGPGDRGYVPEVDSVLRRIRAEGRRALLDEQSHTLARALIDAESAPTNQQSGRRRYGLRAARDLLGLVDPYAAPADDPWTRRVGGIVGQVDSVDVGVYLALEDGQPDPLPVRLLVCDGAGGDSGWAYLDPDEADAVAANLTAAAAESRDYAAGMALLETGPEEPS